MDTRGLELLLNNNNPKKTSNNNLFLSPQTRSNISWPPLVQYGQLITKHISYPNAYLNHESNPP